MPAITGKIYLNWFIFVLGNMDNISGYWIKLFYRRIIDFESFVSLFSLVCQTRCQVVVNGGGDIVVKRNELEIGLKKRS